MIEVHDFAMTLVCDVCRRPADGAVTVPWSNLDEARARAVLFAGIGGAIEAWAIEFVDGSAFCPGCFQLARWVLPDGAGEPTPDDFL